MEQVLLSDKKQFVCRHKNLLSIEHVYLFIIAVLDQLELLNQVHFHQLPVLVFCPFGSLPAMGSLVKVSPLPRTLHRINDQIVVGSRDIRPSFQVLCK